MAHPGGRPTKYKPEYCDMVVEHMKGGLSLQSFAAEIDVNIDTVNEWRKVHEEFSVAVKRGRDHQASFWEKLGRAAATGKIKNTNPTIFIWMTKNMLKWRDKTEISGPEGQSLSLTALVKQVSQEESDG